MPTNVRADQVWELSPAFEQHNTEMRAQVFKVLSNYGASGHDQWPARASIISVQTPDMHPSAMWNYITCGQQGLHRQIAREDLPQVVAWSPYDPHVDCWFVPSTLGNTDGNVPAEWELWAYIVTVHELVVIHLGCDHTDRITVKESGAYERFNCMTCDYTWGINTNGTR